MIVKCKKCGAGNKDIGMTALLLNTIRYDEEAEEFDILDTDNIEEVNCVCFKCDHSWLWELN